MTDQYIGEIRNFGFSYPPRGWVPCNGQLLEISQYTALYSLLGTHYGGDGRITFAVPDLRGRVSVNQGQGPGLSYYPIGSSGGAESVTLGTENMPRHNHDLKAATSEANTDDPTDGALANTRSNLYTTSVTGTEVDLASGTISAVGNNRPIENRQPYQVTNFCIALEGDFPPRS